MFAPPLSQQNPATGRARPNFGEHLSARQVAFETFLKNISTGTVAVVMLFALALLSAIRGDESSTKASAAAEATKTHIAIPEEKRSFQASVADLKTFGNKCALNW